MEVLGLIDLPVWFLGLIAVVAAVCIYTRYKQTTFTRNGIRQTRTTFFLGKLYSLIKQGSGLFNVDLVNDNGKVFGMYIGNVPVLVISDTEIIMEVLVKQFPKFTDRFRAIVRDTKSEWASAVNNASGEHWKFLRSTLSPSFSSGKLRNMSLYINKSLGNFMDILEEKRQNQENGFDISPVIRGFTMDVICSTGFGLEVDSQRNADDPFITHAKMFLERRLRDSPFVLFALFFPDLIYLLRPVKQQLVPKKPYEFFKRAIESALKEREKLESPHRDLLQLMKDSNKKGKCTESEEESSESAGRLTFDEYKKRGLTDSEILVNSILFMIAGYETTASTLQWLVYDLMVNNEVQDKLISEIDKEIGQNQPNYDNTFKLKYLDMIVNETLRMHPPATMINRMACEDVDICGLQIKKNWMVSIPTLALHFMPEYWEDPMRYNPERFAATNQSNIDHYAYLPFGGGPRNCIGMRLALLEVKMTLITLLQKYKLVKSPDLVVPMPSTTRGLFKPAKPVLVKLEQIG